MLFLIPAIIACKKNKKSRGQNRKEFYWCNNKFMQEFTINGATGSSIIILDHIPDRLPDLLPGVSMFVITDEHVESSWGHLFPKAPVFAMKAGEESKTIDTAVAICRWLSNLGAGRKSLLLGFGGGVVCDMTGFVASVFMRGIQFGLVPTSLIAQIDAAIGGKTGVNLDGFKNMIGTFRQPKFVLIDQQTLNTLPDNEFRNGLAEAVKHCLIADKPMFNKLMDQAPDVLAKKPDLIRALIEHSVRVKVDIVNRDELEAGERRKLNLGHTWGHAVEKTEKIPHGQAVSIGLAFAARLSEKKGLLQNSQQVEIIKLLQLLGLPTETKTPDTLIFDAIQKDKKKEGDIIHFVFIKDIGSAEVIPIPVNELTKGFIQ